MLFAGGGVKGGRVVGSSDKIGGYPRSDPQTPENLAATIYDVPGHARDRRLARRPGPPAFPRGSDRGALLIARSPEPSVRGGRTLSHNIALIVAFPCGRAGGSSRQATVSTIVTME